MKRIFALAAAVVLSQSIHAKADRDADLQYNLCDKPNAIREAFDLKKSDGKSRDVYLFETSELHLFDRGLQIRLRIRKNKAQLSIKRFDLSETEFAGYRNDPDFGCEIDVHDEGRARVLSCSVNRALSSDEAGKLIDGRTDLENELSDREKALLADARLNAAALKSTRALGPIESLVWDFHAADLSNALSLEQQTLPNGNRYVEFSLKTKERDLPDGIRSAERLFAAKNLSLCADQSGQRKEKLVQLLSGK